MNCSPPGEAGGRAGLAGVLIEDAPLLFGLAGVDERVLAAGHLAEHAGRMDEEPVGPPQGEPLQERAGLQGVLEVGKGERAFLDLEEEPAEALDVLEDRGEVACGVAGAAFLEAGVLGPRARMADDGVEVALVEAGAQPFRDGRELGAGRIGPAGGLAGVDLGGARGLGGAGLERADVRGQGSDVAGGDRGGNVEVEAQAADGLDEDVAMGIELADERFEGRVDLVGPAARQSGPRLPDLVDGPPQPVPLGRPRLQDPGALLGRPHLLGDGAGVDRTQVGGVGGQSQAGSERRRNHADGGLEAPHGLGGVPA